MAVEAVAVVEGLERLAELPRFRVHLLPPAVRPQQHRQDKAAEDRVAEPLQEPADRPQWISRVIGFPS